MTDDRETVRRRFAEAGLADDRFVAVVDGEKKCVDHDTRHDRPPGGNFGIYADADDPLVVLDVDDYGDDGDAAVAQGLAGLARLPATLQQASPHGGTHHIYQVESGGEPVAEVFDRAFGTANPVASWGDLQVANKYVVGAGSQLEGCGKAWCDDCADPEGGRYTVGEDTEIATVDADDMVEALRADPKLAPDDEGDESAEEGGESDGGGSPEVTETLAFALDESDDDGLRRLWRGAGDADDRSVAECTLATKLGWWLGHNRSTIGTKRVVADVLDGQHTPDGWAPPNVEKWDERGEDYRETVLEAVEEVDEAFSPAGGGSPPSSADRPLRERIAAASDAIDGPEDVPEDILDAARSLDPDADEAGDESGEDTGESDEELEAEAETTATADGGTAAASADDDSGPRLASTLEPESVRVVAGVDTADGEEIADLTDRAKAAAVWELIGRSNEVHVRVRRDNGSLWAFDDGVWKNEGERALRHAARQALGPVNYGSNVLKQLKAQARADPSAEVGADRFGLEPGLVAVENGLLDLDAAAEDDDALRALRPSDYAMTRLPVRYDPEAEADEWRELVREWAEDGRAKALQEYVGYCLHIGAFPIHRVLLLVGGGANGKGTFLKVVRALLGDDNTSSIELQTLANERQARADMYGALANFDDDLSARKLGNGLGMFKKIAAGDEIRARANYESAFEYPATEKHLYAANEVPEVDVPEDDDAFWRRWLLVEFPNHYPQSERDPQLADRLTTDDTLSGVLNWAAEGRRRLLDQGRFTGEATQPYEKCKRWRKWGDSVAKFVEEHVEHDKEADRVSTSDVHRVYAAWCRQNDDLDPVGQQKLTNTLKKEDYGYGRLRIDGQATRGFSELALGDDLPDLDDTPDRDTASGQQSLTD